MSTEDYLKGYLAASSTWSDEYAQLKGIQPEDQASNGYCYIAALEDDEVKIGFVHSKDRLVYRWKELSLQKSYKIHPVAVIGGGYFKEQFLHKKFKATRIATAGERFKLTSGLKSYIDHARFHPLVTNEVAEWYGPSFSPPRDLFAVEVSPKVIRRVKGFCANGARSVAFSSREESDLIIVSCNTEVNLAKSCVDHFLSSVPAVWYKEEIFEHRSVWDMEF